MMLGAGYLMGLAVLGAQALMPTGTVYHGTDGLPRIVPTNPRVGHRKQPTRHGKGKGRADRRYVVKGLRP